ncbi:FCD domain-containing protein [Streptomyces sp. CS113]|uniref:FCD domain-containing protein n=1 Tax=Streptomyces sp. CS113 TaxID=1982761 RepID=UPI00211B1A0A|nr:FCD domain-containing protein [Streptomyces sp. CS113]
MNSLATCSRPVRVVGVGALDAHRVLGALGTDGFGTDHAHRTPDSGACRTLPGGARRPTGQGRARRVTGRLDAEPTRLLAEDVARLRRAAAEDDIGAFRDGDMSFHRPVCEAAGNAAMIRLWRMIKSSMWDLHVLGDPRYAGSWGAMAEHHADLLDVLRHGDPDTAGPMFADHAAGEVARYLPDRSGPAPGPGR